MIYIFGFMISSSPIYFLSHNKRKFYYLLSMLYTMKSHPYQKFIKAIYYTKMVVGTIWFTLIGKRGGTYPAGYYCFLKLLIGKFLQYWSVITHISTDQGIICYVS